MVQIQGGGSSYGKDVKNAKSQAANNQAKASDAIKHAEIEIISTQKNVPNPVQTDKTSVLNQHTDLLAQQGKAGLQLGQLGNLDGNIGSNLAERIRTGGQGGDPSSAGVDGKGPTGLELGGTLDGNIGSNLADRIRTGDGQGGDPSSSGSDGKGPTGLGLGGTLDGNVGSNLVERIRTGDGQGGDPASGGEDGKGADTGKTPGVSVQQGSGTGISGANVGAKNTVRTQITSQQEWAYQTPDGGSPAPAPAPSGGNPAPAPAPSGGNPAPAPAPSGGNPAPAPAPSGGNPAPAPAPSGGNPAPAPGGGRPDGGGTPSGGSGRGEGRPGPTVTMGPMVGMGQGQYRPSGGVWRPVPGGGDNRVEDSVAFNTGAINADALQQRLNESVQKNNKTQK